MSSEQVDNNAPGSKVIAAESVKPNRYEVYGNSEAGKLVNTNLKTSPSQKIAINSVGTVLGRQNPQEKGVTLHIKELAVPGKDNGSLNSVYTLQRPKSAVSAEPSNLCSLFGVSLNQPLKYSRNAVNIKDVMDNRRRSSCSDLTKTSKASKN
ncbi:hypothetical protein OS493_022740 [Desmophyllum pertusum]|uniref:Uncharacterized protein n=1 Tax=Desmophyllum pertusum TaxID=174260 RepID=A0A9W9YAR6_9CNID|nr:hypothetical protein OS493_022740 [Desmophyllum pertusum]